jgi:hypothetical protein
MIVIDDVFGPGMLEAIQNTARSQHYEPLERTARSQHYDPLGIKLGSTCGYLASCPKFFEKVLNERLREELGEFDTIGSYFRKNSEVLDNHMRIHADVIVPIVKSASSVQDKSGCSYTPTHGVVFYADIEEGGTGFYDHKVYGDRLPEGVSQPEEEYGDESLWTFREYLEGKPNRMVVYPANMFHMRHPIKTPSDRLVWVSFIQVK